MSKEVELNITIDKDGKVIVTPKGTQGKECLELMKFLDKIPGLNVVSTTPNADLDAPQQNVSSQHQQQ
jgi:hypothetical protein